MSMVMEAPRLLTSEVREETEAEWAVFAAVAAIIGVPLAIVIYICSVCEARSFDACMDAVWNYWGSGC